MITLLQVIKGKGKQRSKLKEHNREKKKEKFLIDEIQVNYKVLVQKIIHIKKTKLDY